MEIKREALEKEKLYQQYAISKKAKIEAFGELLGPDKRKISRQGFSFHCRGYVSGRF